MKKMTKPETSSQRRRRKTRQRKQEEAEYLLVSHTEEEEEQGSEENAPFIRAPLPSLSLVPSFIQRVFTIFTGK
jgi:hypothetical protein